MSQNATIVAVGAHPDDVILGVGGTLARFSEAGYSVVIVTLTSGELGGSSSVREDEDRAAARCLGAEITFARLPDGSLTVRSALQALESVLTLHRPATVFVHDMLDRHQDHVEAGRAAAIACRDVPNLYYYEGPTTIAFAPTASFDISQTWKRKQAALAAHGSQRDVRRLDTWSEAAARFRAWPRFAGGYCEAFRADHADLPMREQNQSVVASPASVFGSFALPADDLFYRKS
jgi:LmbE family N-acetylglucosaminyl deacetylase